MHLVLCTHDPYRADKVEQAVADQGWALTTAIAHSQPFELLRLRTADVILLDMDVPGAMDLVQRFARSYPAIPLLALATPSSMVELQQALLIGAVAFVLFPFDARQFVALVQRVAQEGGVRSGRGPGRQSRLIAVAGLKGGIGRTTVATNLAVTLARRHPDDVILVEAHGGLGDASLLLNLRPQRTLASLAGELRLDADVVQGHLQVHHSSLRVLAAPTAIARRADLSPENWRSVLGLLRGLAQFVVVDTGPSPDGVLSEVLSAASDIVVLALPEIPAVRASASLCEALRHDPDSAASVRLVLNREGITGGLSARSINQWFGRSLDAVLAENPSLTLHAANRGEPFVMTHARALLSRQIGMLAERLAAPRLTGAAAPATRNVGARTGDAVVAALGRRNGAPLRRSQPA